MTIGQLAPARVAALCSFAVLAGKSRGDSVDTESLRVALRRYRSFFDRLLSV